jgi:glycosyltransferase involved in cell wall biosynthesis
MKNPVINILTRTSNRPNFFKICFESVSKQTYKNINHIISVDNIETEEYVKKYTDNYIVVKKFDGYIPYNPIYDVRRPAPYNLYLNELKNG